jgi:serine/threonine-protein kinase RsbW
MKTISTEIASVKNNYVLIESLLRKANEDFCCNEDRFRNVLIAVSELVMNAIVHGNKEEESKKVRVTVEYDKDIMKIKILDEGNGFKFDKDSKTKLPDDLLKLSGRGIFIAKSLVEQLDYRDTSEGTEFVLTVKKKEAV